MGLHDDCFQSRKVDEDSLNVDKITLPLPSRYWSKGLRMPRWPAMTELLISQRTTGRSVGRRSNPLSWE